MLLVYCEWFVVIGNNVYTIFCWVPHSRLHAGNYNAVFFCTTEHNKEGYGTKQRQTNFRGIFSADNFSI